MNVCPVNPVAPAEVRELLCLVLSGERETVFEKLCKIQGQDRSVLTANHVKRDYEVNELLVQAAIAHGKREMLAGIIEKWNSVLLDRRFEFGNYLDKLESELGSTNQEGGEG